MPEFSLDAMATLLTTEPAASSLPMTMNQCRRRRIPLAVVGGSSGLTELNWLSHI
ncbi:hypothetical protein [Mycobacterium sp.]|uniref:hypothetical protein n=1 Tax=Mycobacterium sp. TaxID=1785 RepID=UPI003BA94DAC